MAYFRVKRDKIHLNSRIRLVLLKKLFFKCWGCIFQQFIGSEKGNYRQIISKSEASTGGCSELRFYYEKTPLFKQLEEIFISAACKIYHFSGLANNTKTGFWHPANTGFWWHVKKLKNDSVSITVKLVPTVFPVSYVINIRRVCLSFC